MLPWVPDVGRSNPDTIEDRTYYQDAIMLNGMLQHRGAMSITRSLFSSWEDQLSVQ